MESVMVKNPFLGGPLEPLRNEYTIHDLRVIGEIPKELNGTLYRNGSNQHFHPLHPDRYHWFDGDGMVHAFHLRDGRASYCNRWVLTDGLRAEITAGRALYNGIYGHSGIPQDTNLPEGAPLIKTTANITVIKLAGRTLALHEAEYFYYEIDSKSLETLGKFYFDDRVQGMLTGHPHEDPRTGEMLFYALDNENKKLQCFSVRKTDGQITALHNISMPVAAWCHDFMFTPDYFIFTISPLRYRPRTRPLRGESAYAYEYDEIGRILLVHRKTGETKWFEFSNPIAVGHYLNAYQDGNMIIVDCAVSGFKYLPKEPFIVSDVLPYEIGNVKSPLTEMPYLCRISIDTVNNKVKHEKMADYPAEFVRINESIMGEKYRFGYMETIHEPHERKAGLGFNSLVKYDYKTGKSYFQKLTRDYDMIPGEPIFVPKPNSKAEDDGWILSVWYDPRTNTSELVILEAADFDGEPVARIKLDHRIPLDFHGNWVPDII
jgi:carotenoid cleavage dioxygenase